MLRRKFLPETEEKSRLKTETVFFFDIRGSLVNIKITAISRRYPVYLQGDVLRLTS